MSWIVFSLLSSFFWAIANNLDKILASKYSKSPFALTAAFSTVSLPIAICFALYFGLPIVPASFVLAIIASGMLVTAGVFYYVKALAIEEASRVVPLWNLSTIFTLILATLFLGERLSTLHYISFTLLFLGGILISTRKIESVFRLSPAFFLMVLSSFAFAASDILLKYGHAVDLANQVFALFYLSVALSGFSLFFAKNNRAFFLNAVKKHRWNKLSLLIFSVVFGFIGSWFYNLAVKNGSISLISALSGFQGFFVLLIAALFSFKFPALLKEDTSSPTLIQKTIAICIMLIGLYLLYS